MLSSEFISNVSEKVAGGARFSVNFEKRTLRVDGNLMDLDEIEVAKYEEAFVMDTIDVLYLAYKHSVPSERSESHRRYYFKALPEKELSDEDMMYGEQRECARCELELFVLFAIRSGNLKWHEQWGRWFYQSPRDKDLIILRSWIEPKNGGE